VATVEERMVPLNQTCVGTVTPVRTSTVGSPVDGRVVARLPEEGNFVSANDGDQVLPLARLRTEPAEIELAAAQAELTVLEHKLAELKLSAPKEIEQALARKEAAEALMNYARWRLEQTQELRKRDATTEDELEKHRSEAQSAQKAYVEHKAAWELANSGLWTEKIKQAEASVEAQKQAIGRLKDDLAQCEIFAPFDGFVTKKHTEIGQWVAAGDPIAEVVEIDDVYVEVPVSEAYVSQLRQPLFLFRVSAEGQDDLNQGVLSTEIQQELEKCGITFSSSNLEDDGGNEVVVLTEKEGSRWRICRQCDRESTPCEEQSYTVIRREALEVYRPGTTAQVKIAALPGRAFCGEVVAVVPKADVRSRSFPVKVRLRNPKNPADPNDLLLKPGMFARVTFPVEKKTRLVVPKDSLVLGETSPTVWVVEPESGDKILGPGKVERVAVDVELRATDEQWIEILGPVDGNGSLALKPGHWVVVEGNERLVPGRPVNVVKIWQ